MRGNTSTTKRGVGLSEVAEGPLYLILSGGSCTSHPYPSGCQSLGPAANCAVYPGLGASLGVPVRGARSGTLPNQAGLGS